MTDHLSGGVVQPTDARIDALDAAYEAAMEAWDKALPQYLRGFQEWTIRFDAAREAFDRLAVPQAPLQAEPVPVVASEPTLYQYRLRPGWVNPPQWQAWAECSAQAAADYERTPLLHDWHYEVRRLFAAPQAEPAVAEQARDFEMWWDRQKHSPNFPDMTRPEAVYVWTAALASQSTPPPESAGTVRFDIPAEDCFVWDGAPKYPMVTCMDCKATDYGISRLEHKPGCRVNAILAANPTAKSQMARDMIADMNGEIEG